MWQRWPCCFTPPCGCGSSTKPGPCNRWQPWPEPTLESEIRLKGYDERPSLNWYAEQRIQRFKGGPGRRLSDKPQKDCITEGQAGRWTLANCR